MSAAARYLNSDVHRHIKNTERPYFSGAAAPSSQESCFQEVLLTGLVGRAHRYKTHRESWSNMMPYAQWAKFDTSGSIKHWLNVINKPVEPSCSPCARNRPKVSPELHHCCRFQQFLLWLSGWPIRGSSSFVAQASPFISRSSRVLAQSRAPSFCLFMILCKSV